MEQMYLHRANVVAHDMSARAKGLEALCEGRGLSLESESSSSSSSSSSEEEQQ